MSWHRVRNNLDFSPVCVLVDGNWGQWSEITPCNKSCGYGYRHRHRACDSPADAHGGEKCYGPAVDVIPECNVQKCPGSHSTYFNLYLMFIYRVRASLIASSFKEKESKTFPCTSKWHKRHEQ